MFYFTIQVLPMMSRTWGWSGGDVFYEPEYILPFSQLVDGVRGEKHFFNRQAYSMRCIRHPFPNFHGLSDFKSLLIYFLIYFYFFFKSLLCFLFSFPMQQNVHQLQIVLSCIVGVGANQRLLLAITIKLKIIVCITVDFTPWEKEGHKHLLLIHTH